MQPEIGTVFKLRRRPDGANFGIPTVDFGREMVVTGPPHTLGCVLSEFTDGKPTRHRGLSDKGWFVYPDMMEPTGGPW